MKVQKLSSSEEIVFFDLNHDIFYQIFYSCLPIDLLNLQMTHRVFYDAMDSIFWKICYSKTFKVHHLDENENWKQIFNQRIRYHHQLIDKTSKAKKLFNQIGCVLNGDLNVKYDDLKIDQDFPIGDIATVLSMTCQLSLRFKNYFKESIREDLKPFFQFLLEPTSILVQKAFVDNDQEENCDNTIIVIKLYDYQGIENIITYIDTVELHGGTYVDWSVTWERKIKGKKIYQSEHTKWDEKASTEFQTAIIGPESLPLLSRKKFILFIFSLFENDKFKIISQCGYQSWHNMFEKEVDNRGEYKRFILS